LGLFVVASLFFIRKALIPIKHKIIIATIAIVFLAWITSLVSKDNIRPNLSSSFIVGEKVMLHEGPFGIGPGNFNRAWQLYRPAAVIDSPYFGYDFNQGGGTITMLFINIGIFGLIAFLLLVLSALYNTYLSYRKTHTGNSHFILGTLSIILLYFVCVSFVVPLSYSMLVVWMVVAGLGIAKSSVEEYRLSHRISFLMIPLAIIFVINIFEITKKAQAFAYAAKAQVERSPDISLGLLMKATQIYPFDEFYRSTVESAIQSNRLLIIKSSPDKESFQKKYLERTQIAIDAAHEAIKYNSDNYQNYISLGRAYELAIPFDKKSEYNNAKKAYKEAIKLFPDNPYLYVILARLEASAGTKEDMRLALNEALKKKPNFADTLYLMSKLEESEQNIDVAINYAIEAIKNAPDDALTYLQAGTLFYKKKDYQNAIISLNTALEKDHNNPNVLYFLALAFRDSKQTGPAKQIADELIKHNPTNPDLMALFNSLNISTSTQMIKGYNK
jgi:tetratricopeptide (TPR) repeat protein